MRRVARRAERLVRAIDPKGVVPMRRKGSVFLIAAVALITSGTAWGGGFSLAVKAGYFLPADDVFKDVYKNGPVFGAELAISALQNLDIWAGAEIFSKTGTLTFTEEPTKIRIVPLTAGLRFRFSSGSVSPYLAAGGGLYLYNEENVLGTTSGSGFGFVGQGGVLIEVSNVIALDLHGRYGVCKVKPEDIEESVDLGGFRAGAALVLRF
jgi:opacity protein-like surface antigen